jgi:phosphatidylserine decarboxylase
VLTLYIKWVDIDMRGVQDQDLTHYQSINDFFLRKMDPRSRPTAKTCLVAPADSYTYHFGMVDDERVIRDVKGFNYSLSAFFGKDVANNVHDLIEQKNNSAMWYIICYLSPADCHRYFAPADITLNFRRHFTGRLQSVVDSELFDVNERMLVTGEWKYGFFSLTAVGAIHVGEIDFYFDDRHTNIKKDTVGTHDDKSYKPPVKKEKGEAFGQFACGSVIVLVFQAPLSFKFTISKGDKFQYGQAIGDCSE